MAIFLRVLNRQKILSLNHAYPNAMTEVLRNSTLSCSKEKSSFVIAIIARKPHLFIAALNRFVKASNCFVSVSPQSNAGAEFQAGIDTAEYTRLPEKEQDRYERAVEIARKMKEEGLPSALISKLTGLSEREIESRD